MNDLAAQCAHPLDRDRNVGDRKIGKGEAVAGAAAALVQPQHDPLVLGPPTLPLLSSTAFQCDLQQLLPEAPRPFRLVGGKLDQKPRCQCLAPYR